MFLRFRWARKTGGRERFCIRIILRSDDNHIAEGSLLCYSLAVDNLGPFFISGEDSIITSKRSKSHRAVIFSMCLLVKVSPVTNTYRDGILAFDTSLTAFTFDTDNRPCGIGRIVFLANGHPVHMLEVTEVILTIILIKVGIKPNLIRMAIRIIGEMPVAVNRRTRRATDRSSRNAIIRLHVSELDIDIIIVSSGLHRSPRRLLGRLSVRSKDTGSHPDPSSLNISRKTIRPSQRRRNGLRERPYVISGLSRFSRRPHENDALQYLLSLWDKRFYDERDVFLNDNHRVVQKLNSDTTINPGSRNTVDILGHHVRHVLRICSHEVSDTEPGTKFGKGRKRRSADWRIFSETSCPIIYDARHINRRSRIIPVMNLDDSGAGLQRI